MEKENITGAYLGLTYANNVWVDYDGSGRSRRRRSSQTSREPSSKATGPQERFGPWVNPGGMQALHNSGITQQDWWAAPTKATTTPSTTASTAFHAVWNNAGIFGHVPVNQASWTFSKPTKPATTVPAGKSFAIDATHNCHRLFRHWPWIVVQSS